MGDRPVFAFEPSFLDRLTRHYDTTLDPSSSSDDNVKVWSYHGCASATSCSRHNVATRVASSGPTSSTAAAAAAAAASPGSLWFLRKSGSAEKRSTSSTNTSFRPPSTGSLGFTMPATSLNSLNLSSIDSMNNFLKGLASGDSISNMFDGTVDSNHYLYTATNIEVAGGRSSVAEDAIMKDSSSSLVAPDGYETDDTGRLSDDSDNDRSTFEVQRAESAAAPTHVSAPSLPSAPPSSKTAAYLMSFYTARAQTPAPDSHQTVPACRTIVAPTSTNMGSSTSSSWDTQHPFSMPASLSPVSAAAAAAANKYRAKAVKQQSERIAARKAIVSKATPPSPPSTTSAAKTTKRIRRKEPIVRKYAIVTENDVLLGRGGGSNHHKGNKAYRKRILDLQPIYKTLDRDAKTVMSETVVQEVQDQGGRFLKRECKSCPWYIVTDQTARQKVSQALREDHTPAGRALKKSRTSFTPSSSKNKKNKKKKNSE